MQNKQFLKCREQHPCLILSYTKTGYNFPIIRTVQTTHILFIHHHHHHHHQQPHELTSEPHPQHKPHAMMQIHTPYT
ncbi:hypothetical protein BO70DRAFT_85184 [Aspergillus heteromorphus CBS 117.55]|uniref:Uncharacterized protein n=1 Tax=Aspergillus heteromorphus CBS 117.55 TaxID=1448321 RepID=A0A317WYS6_9EURO|nr:uncharacterized protein BO70DRAFT_85184 [Aspergillus heteromorphus CBS 117.55]PWY91111.1 hypothetical protein BO70DRAFT_85184 [Aspergillus heteromorphus CBS 117.55]